MLFALSRSLFACKASPANGRCGCESEAPVGVTDQYVQRLNGCIFVSLQRRNVSVDIRAKTLVVLKKDTPKKAFRWTEIMGSEQLDDSHLQIRFYHHRECVHLFNCLVWWG